MREAFLISTSRHLLLYREDLGFFLVHSGNGPYYGLAVDGSTVYVACRNQFQGDRPVGQRGTVLVFDSSTWELVDHLIPDFPLRDVHGAMYADNCVWVTCTADNLVAIYNAQTESWTKWYPSENPLHRDRDFNHYNTIVDLGDRIGLVAHNNGKSQIFYYSKHSLALESVIELGREAHDLFEVDGVPAVCSSKDGKLINMKGQSFATGGYPRGVAFGANSILIGVSQICARASRHHETGILLKLTFDWKLTGLFKLRGVGMMLTVIRLNIPSDSFSNLVPFVDVEPY